MITIQKEPWEEVSPEVFSSWKLHYEEIALDKERIPLDPDWEKYDRLAQAGILHIVTVRTGGILCGYIFLIVDTHLHYKSTLFAVYDIYWLHPNQRRGWNGIKLFKVAENVARELGVTKICAPTKLNLDNSKIFLRLGWKEIEKVFSKLL